MNDGGIVSTTLVYPTPDRPTQGVFVQRRLEAMHEVSPLSVVAPRPWFPVWRPAARSMVIDAIASPPVVRPRMFYLPGMLKSRDADYYAASFMAGLRCVADRFRTKVVDAHFEWPDAVGAWRVAREAGLKFVVTLRGKLVSQSRHPKRRRLIAQMLRDADGLIAVSRSLARLADEVAERELNACVIPNGIDTDVFYRSSQLGSSGHDRVARETLGWDAAARYVVCVGHLQRIKGFHRLVEIWPDVCAIIGNARLMLVGGDAGETRYARELTAGIAEVNRRLAPPLGAVPVTLCGRREQREIARMLNAADLFVLASDSEGWCNAISEALACGCPVVCTDVGGNSEQVATERLGRVVSPNDASALASTIVEALSTPWNRAEIAAHGGRRSWRTVGEQCVAYIQQVSEARRMNRAG